MEMVINANVVFNEHEINFMIDKKVSVQIIFKLNF